MIIYVCNQRSFKPAFETVFSVHIIHLNSKWIMCSRKTGVKCGNLRSFIYKNYQSLCLICSGGRNMGSASPRPISSSSRRASTPRESSPPR